MKIKTSELKAEDGTLDWAVAKCEGYAEGLKPYKGADGTTYLATEHGYTHMESRSWAQGGPIIGRERIDLHHCQNGEGKYETLAQLREHSDPTGKLLACAWAVDGEGPDKDLIAAMRCYVASRLGDEVDVPDELGL